MRTNSFFVTITNIILMAIILFACNTPEDMPGLTDTELQKTESADQNKAQYTYLALGDSYTVGQSVSPSKSFPAQLEKLLEKNLKVKITTEMVATTGWRTDNLLDGIASRQLTHPYDFITLLIGVNNQYQGRPFSQYEEEFPKLLELALQLSGNDSGKVIVVSIPDYAYTPFGENRGREHISRDIDKYNTFAEKTAQQYNITYVNITDITRKGIDQPELVANDGLHPSGEAYTTFASRIAPFVVSELKD